MALTEPARPADGAQDQSLGELVSLATKDLSRLVKGEMELAKLELRADIKRLGLAGAMLGVAVFVICLFLVFAGFALADGLITLGIWDWAAFLIVGGVCVLVAAIAGLIALLRVRGLSGLRRTRKSVQEGLALMHRDETATAPAVEAG